MCGPKSPRAPRTRGGICPLVSCRLCDSVRGVGESITCPLVRAALGSPEPWMLGGSVDAQDGVGPLPRLWLSSVQGRVRDQALATIGWEPGVLVSP
jgi:hypothetical protein